jgi:hypothetical protein
MTKEVANFVNSALGSEKGREMGDIYVTDHTHRPRQVLTNSEDEDMDYFNYRKSLEAYNSDVKAKK